MNISMWKTIRKANRKTQTEVACDLGITKQAINKYENGVSPMPVRVQIYYLQMRNSKTDKIIIDYFKEGLNNGKHND